MSYPTWSDLNNESIVPPLGAGKAPQIGPVAIMVSCEPDLRLIRSNVSKPEIQPFFLSTLITSHGRDKGICIAGPFIGAPYAAMVLESLIARGVEKVIMLGWCGAVTDDLSVGDLIVPQKAIVDEGTSQNYCHMDDDFPCSHPDQTLGDLLARQFKSNELEVKRSDIWTTDAIYRETQKKISYFRALGATAVEMECSALFSVAQYRNISITALLVVSDSVASKDWDPGFRKKQFKKARKTACNGVMDLARELSV
ncbi:MAG: nucleoside phosphorylase [Desulfobacula sp.]|nr:nucleoside phosphorylase [Desulfobacula sp.]